MKKNDKQYIIAIDPGKNGGIAAIYNNKIIDISDLPSNPQEFYEHLIYLGLPRNYEGKLTIAIEKVHSMPTDGSKAAFTFGQGLGRLEGVIAAMSLSEALKWTLPQEWMKHFKMQKTKEETKYNYKKRLKELAIKLSKRDLTLKTCDAFLLAKYTHQKLKGVQNESKVIFNSKGS